MTAFLQKHYNEYVDYLLSLTYPGEKLAVMPETGTHNVWGGPQCMVPDSLTLDECAYVLAPNRETKAFIEGKMTETGTVLNVKCVEECSPLAFPPPPGTDNFMRAFNMLTYQIPSNRQVAK